MNFRAHRQAESTIPPNLSVMANFQNQQGLKHEKYEDDKRKNFRRSQVVPRQMGKTEARYRQIMDFWR